MKLFLDTPDVQAVARYVSMGIIDGAMLGAHAFGPVGSAAALTDDKGHQVAKARELCAMLPDGEVMVHVASNDPHELMQHAQLLAKLSDSVVVEIPYAVPLYPTIAQLVEQGIPVSIVGITSVGQAIMMAKLGVVSVSVDVCSADTRGRKGVELLAELRDIFDTYASETELIAVHPASVEEFELVATLGVDGVVLTPALLDALIA
jgi:transaldolase